MKAANPSVVKVNNVDVNVLAVDTGAYPDSGIPDILAYNHLDNPSAQGTTLRAGLAGRFDLLTCGLPAIPVVLYGNRYPTVGSLVLYKMTVMTKEQEFSASVTGGATVTATADGLVVQMPATPGDVVLTVNHYAFRIVVQDQAAVNPYVADHIITANGIIPDPAMGGFGNFVKVSKDGNWLITGLQGVDIDGVTETTYMAVFSKIQSGNKYLWQFNALLNRASPDTGITFGVWAFDINADGSVIAVGAFDSKVTEGNYSPQNPANGAGDVTLFARTGQTWSSGHRCILLGTGPATYKGFGYSVALNDAGTRFVVGQPNIASGLTPTDEIVTSIWIIDYNASTGNFAPSRIRQSQVNERYGSLFGQGVAISGDGTKIFASNFFYRTPGAEPIARIDEYQFDVNGTFISSTPVSSITYDPIGQTYPEACQYFGDRNFSLTDDSNTLIVGYSFAEVNGEFNAGFAQVFKRQGGGWVKHSEFNAPAGIQTGGAFGQGVGLTPDGGYLFIGAGENYNNIPREPGSLYVYKLDTQTDTYSSIARIRSEFNYLGGAFGRNFSYDRVSKYLAVCHESDSDGTINGTIHYIPVGNLIV